MNHAVSFVAAAVLTLAAHQVEGQVTADAYRVLATNKTSTMQQEMSETSGGGYRFVSVMGGETSFGGSEVVVIMGRVEDGAARYDYRLLATSKTSTMKKELQDAADAGFAFVGQTVFRTAFGGSEVVCIFERDKQAAEKIRYEYDLLATKKTSTLQKELQDAVEKGFEVVGLTVGETFVGGSELVTILRRRQK